jgi:hypothetical protein
MVKESIKEFKADEAGEGARNLFTERLFNRLMFIAFIQKLVRGRRVAESK